MRKLRKYYNRPAVQSAAGGNPDYGVQALLMNGLRALLANIVLYRRAAHALCLIQTPFKGR